MLAVKYFTIVHNALYKRRSRLSLCKLQVVYFCHCRRCKNAFPNDLNSIAAFGFCALLMLNLSSRNSTEPHRICKMHFYIKGISSFGSTVHVIVFLEFELEEEREVLKRDN